VIDRLELTPEQLLTTTRAVRRRLDLDRPVDPELIRKCVRIAIQAPSGSNRQPWQFIVVTDPDQRAGLADVYRRGFEPYQASEEFRGWLVGGETPQERSQQRVAESARHLAEHLHRVPALLVPVLAGKPGPSRAEQAGYWGSIIPAVWSFMLAARSFGLGTAWTTLHLGHQEAAAELLGFSADAYTQVGLFPIAHTIGTDFKPARRREVDEVLHWDRFNDMAAGATSTTTGG
jgi:nitroreductase